MTPIWDQSRAITASQSMSPTKVTALAFLTFPVTYSRHGLRNMKYLFHWLPSRLWRTVEEGSGGDAEERLRCLQLVRWWRSMSAFATLSTTNQCIYQRQGKTKALFWLNWLKFWDNLSPNSIPHMSCVPNKLEWKQGEALTYGIWCLLLIKRLFRLGTAMNDHNMKLEVEAADDMRDQF